MRTQLPTLEPGVSYLEDGDAPGALYRLVGSHLTDAAGRAYWIDARNAACPETLREHTTRRCTERIRVARAFTGFQHYELVRGLPKQVSQRTTLVVAPNVASLYADDNMPDQDADAMLDATLELLSALATAVDAAVIVTADTCRERVRAAADRTLDAEQTRAGLRVEGPSFQTDVYWDDWGFQTTIPYWVDLFGAVGREGEPESVDSMALGV